MPAVKRLSYLTAEPGSMESRSFLGGAVNEPERRKVSLAGLGLIGAGAVLGLALAGPGTSPDETAAQGPGASAPADPPKPPPADD
jgi:hypothetical protein